MPPAGKKTASTSLIALMTALALVSNAFAEPSTIHPSAATGAVSDTPTSAEAPLQSEPIPLKEPTPAELDALVREVGTLADPVPSTIAVENRNSKLARLLVLGQENALHEYLTSIVNRLALPSDSKRYSIRLKADPTPNAAVYPGRSEMIINIGLLAFCRNEDELASVIAHEMTHDNRTLYAAKADAADIESALTAIEGHSGIPPSQREELRADLGAVKRMIMAGYNPWAQYEFERRFGDFRGSETGFIFKRLFGQMSSHLSTHPEAAIRMAATKAYIAARSRQVDLSALTEATRPFPPAMAVMRARAKLYSDAPTWLLVSKRGRQAQKAALAAAAVNFAYKLLDPEQRHAFSGKLDQAWARVFGPPKEKKKQTYEELEKENDERRREHENDVARQKYAPYMLAGLLGVWWGGLEYLAHIGARLGDAYKSLMATQEEFHKRAKGLPEALAKADQGDLGPLQEIISWNHRRRSELDQLMLGSTDSAARSRPLQHGLKRMAHDTVQAEELLLTELAERMRKLPPTNRKEAYKALVADLTRSGEAHSAMSLLESEPVRAAAEKVARLGLGPDYVEPAKARLHLRIGETKSMQELAEMVEIQRLIANPDAALTPEEALSAVLRLQAQKCWAGADALLARHYRGILQWAFSPGSHPDAVNLLELARAWHINRSVRGLKEIIKREKKIDTRLIVERAARVGATTPDKLALIAHQLGIPRQSGELIPVLAIRYWINKGDRASVRGFFRDQFPSLGELDRFIRKELVPRNVQLGNFANELHEAVLSHPEWPANPEEIRILLENEHFWPTAGASNQAVRAKYRIQALQEVSADFRKRFPNAWKYDPDSAEKLQTRILERLDALDRLPASPAEKAKLWESLTRRGVTSVSDALFKEAYEGSSSGRRKHLAKLALEEGRVWDQGAKARIREARLEADPDYLALRNPSKKLPPGDRQAALERLAKRIQSSSPERGPDYKLLVERVSRDIRSSGAESRYLEGMKSGAAGEKQEDTAIRVLSGLIDTAKKWKKAEQWELVRYLRGDIEPTPFIEKALRSVGSERIRRSFALAPLAERTALLDSFLDASNGLLHEVKVGSGYTAKITDYLLADATSEGRRIGEEVLGAFLHSFQGGNKALRSYVLSYLLAAPKGAAGGDAQGETLKNVLEVFGSTGVKIGQFLAASELLPPAETEMLRKLQERANVPDRDAIYEDLRRALGEKLLAEYEIGDLLGAASLKYAVKAVHKPTGRTVVLKVLRREAIAHTQAEFKQLEAMAEFLIRKHGPKYGVFRSIIRASRQAIERELGISGGKPADQATLASEVINSNAARTHLYDERRSTSQGIELQPPRDELLHPHVIQSEFAPGSSIFSASPETQARAATAILGLESENLFKDIPLDDAREIYFDPDRHPGNFRVSETAGGKVRVSPIDFGQLLKITPAQRGQMLDLFAIAQILKKTGSTGWATAEIARILTLDPKSAARLKAKLGQYFPADDLREVTAYFSVLSAVEEAGRPLGIEYYDFIRGVIQLKQYEALAAAGKAGAEASHPSPSAMLEREVRARADAMAKRMGLTPLEKARIGAAEALQARRDGCSLAEIARRLQGMASP